MFKHSNQVLLWKSGHYFCGIKLIHCIFLAFLFLLSIFKCFSFLFDLGGADLFNFNFDRLSKRSLFFLDLLNNFLNAKDRKSICTGKHISGLRFSTNWRSDYHYFVGL